MSHKVLLTDSISGDVAVYKLVEFTPKDHPEQEGCYLLKPATATPNLQKMTKQQLIDYIEEKDD